MKRILPWIAAAAFAALLLVALGGFFRVRGFLTSAEFQALAAHHAGSALGGEVEFSPIHWNGSAASSDLLRVQGKPHSPLRQLEARHLHATWNWRALFSGVWHIEEISAESLTGTFGAPAGLQAPSATPVHSPTLLPKRFEVGPVRIARAELDFEGTKLLNSALEIQNRDGTWSFIGSGGTLGVPNWPTLGVDSYRARWTPERLTIDSARLSLGSSGLVRASGDWPGKIDFAFSGIEASNILPPPWGKMLQGTLSGNATLAESSISGRFELSQAVLHRADWLAALANITGRPDLLRLQISKANGAFAFRDSAWHWHDLLIESNDLLRIEGGFRISADRQLAGEIQLGVAPDLLRPLPGATEKIFTETRDGFVWTSVVLGGTVEAPSENLTPRLAQAATSQALEAVQPILETVPVRAREAVGDTINTLFDILGQ